MDIFNIICWEIVLFVWKRPKINEKEADDGPFCLKKGVYVVLNMSTIFGQSAWVTNMQFGQPKFEWDLDTFLYFINPVEVISDG